MIGLLDRKLRDLLRALAPRLSRRAAADWPFAPAADVLSADLAIVRAPETDHGWDLRWVEFQAFTSAISTVYTLHRAAVEMWPHLRMLAFWGAPPQGLDWLAATRAWMAPVPGSILLEHEPWSQRTRFDFEAACRWFDLTVATPQDLRARDGQLERRDDGGRLQSVPHVANRVVLHEVPERAALEDLLANVSPGWNSHPAWYYRINKGLMPDLPLTAMERCARGDNWRALGIPAEALVVKPCLGHAGHGVGLHNDAPALDGLPAPRDWIVQPRFVPMPLLNARDGAPLFAEIRCVVALPRDGEAPWVVARFARMTRGAMASAGGWSGAAGEGVVPVYAPPP